ncbi:hypothetical protein ASPZODRAFT_76575 [Penicilliopsis zonata CBS 506.65]|uniref:P-loop containing nucleoside triphosphate hydrolase protein n=1 Tax=Penicilliopsis zonata CBS 506.65 TaxID=1073090 RepID=A0A1L9S664_9EURO|nr:hypothetical protein ASPZODRAFT_76575 [Penicilliopsis zonata CBS 506.65]OJJ42630.1 hypothetical protein ASPZODRAFT_76575 [Penicilliopsis zonata CBS 506.65]
MGYLLAISSNHSVQLYLALSLTLLHTLFPRRPRVFTPDGHPVDGENSSTAFNRYSMLWCVTALRLAGKRNARFPALDYGTRSRTQPLISLVSSSSTLWKYVFTERWRTFAKQWALMFVQSVLTFASPYCVTQLLESLEKEEQRENAWLWLLAMGASAVCETVVHYRLVWIQWSEAGIPIRAQLIMAIFHKALRMKDSSNTSSTVENSKKKSPEAINLLTSDTVSFSKFTAVNHVLPFSCLELLLAGCFLFRLLGWQGTLAAAVVTAGCYPIHSAVVRGEQQAQKKLTTARDKKIRTVTEALHALRQIKFHALEDPWEASLAAVREEELQCVRRCFIASNVRSVWKVASPLLVASAAVITTTSLHEGGDIPVSAIFPLLELLPHLQASLGVIPLVVQDYLGARSNARRMEAFLNREEQKSILSPSLSGRLEFHNASIAWPAGDDSAGAEKEKAIRRFSLAGINLDFPVGEMSVVHGKTGCGKSLLLAAALGEADLLDGRIEVPMVNGKTPGTAFVSQTPWLQNSTLRDNILFGSPLEASRYEQVLAACALHPDLAALPDGDETLIGLRGVKLSGGQRVRVALARALYSTAPVLVLDDILASLDVHVARHVFFRALTGELCRGRTRIMATHQLDLCLPNAQYLVEIHDDYTITGQTTHHLSIDRPVDLEVDADWKPHSAEEKKKKKKKNERTKKIEDKSTLSHSSDMKVYKAYFKAAGGLTFTCIYLGGLISKQLAGALTTGSIRSDPRLYLFSSLLCVLLEVGFNLHRSAGSLRASRGLFRAITARVLRMPLLWLDSTPIGEMLKRFSTDTRMVDTFVLSTLSQCADCLVKMMVIISVGMYTSKYTSVLTLALVYASVQAGRRYLAARKTVAQAEAHTTAEILDLFTSSVSGVSTIRPFGAVNRFVEEMHDRIDALSTARRHFWMFNRWIALQMSLLAILFSVGMGAIGLLISIESSVLGFALAFSSAFSGTLFTAANGFGQLETFMGGASGVVAYSQLETEDQGGLDAPPNWPSKGELQARGLTVSYSPDLDPALKDISFAIGAGQRVGIVGRTGAGKSSLTLALLRLVEPQAGSIHIDGIDISTIKLHALRSRIAFVPQDPVLFSGTVRSNLDYFHRLSDDTLEEALRRVGLLVDKDKINEKSGLYTLDSPISTGGTNMSQGQRQLLCLARILIHEPKIVILDEATSAVDNKTDSLIQDTLWMEQEIGRTLIVVAHRLRTVVSFDQLIVLAEGKIVEMGRPADLWKRRGSFYELVQNSGDRDFLSQTLSHHDGSI